MLDALFCFVFIKINSSLLLFANDKEKKVCGAKISSLVQHLDLKPNCTSVMRFLDLHTKSRYPVFNRCPVKTLLVVIE